MNVIGHFAEVRNDQRDERQVTAPERCPASTAPGIAATAVTGSPVAAVHITRT